MGPPHSSRRQFLAVSLGACGARMLPAQAPSLAHTGVAELERDRVLSQAKLALDAPIIPVTSPQAAHSSSHEFFSETEPDPRTAGATPRPSLFRAEAEALRGFSATVACLSAAYLLTSDAVYAQVAAKHLRASLLTPATCLKPSFDSAGCAPGTTTGTPMGVMDLVPLAELARALPFLVDSQALTDTEWNALQVWFSAANDWLNTSRNPLIARDTRDHRASAWLLIASAFSRLLRNENALEACRKQFRKPTLRNQIRSDGVFPQEVVTPDPYRNTLLNFDLLSGACQLLSSPFDQLWSYELIDGVGMRVVAAYLYPVIAHPEQWSYVADATDFRELPGRRPALLFAGRAYDRPEYVELWKRLPAGPPSANIAGSFPIREPLLWTARAPHGY